jgi:hypothetical protein
MANEISVATTFSAAKGNASVTRRHSYTADWTTARHSAGVQTIGFAAHEVVALGADVATPREAIFINTDATNYVR